jgi:hypothetical protein
MCRTISAVTLLLLAVSVLAACQFDSSYTPVPSQVPNPTQAGGGGGGGGY